MDDSSFLTTQYWSGIARYLHSIWLFFLFTIAFGGMFLMAHAIVPSLLATKEALPEAQRLRPMLYTGSLVCLGLALFFLSRAVDFARIIESFYSRWWI